MTSRATRGESQQLAEVTVYQAPPPTQSPSRRLRRCCCTACRGHHTRRLPQEVVGYGYEVVSGSEVCSRRFMSYAEALIGLRGVGPFPLRRSLEIQRVWLYKNGATNYEHIRGGRWVDWWEAQYGVHKNESKEKTRCT